ncbi:MAG: ABC transporter permease [bacterium]
MKKFLNLLQREIQDVLTLKMVLPFIMSIVILFFLGQLMQTEMVKATKPINIVIVDNDKTQFSQHLIEALEKANYIINLVDGVDDTQAVRIAKEKNCVLCMVIPKGFELNLKNKETASIKIYSVITSLSIASSPRTSIKKILGTINKRATESFIKELSPDLEPEVFREPIKAQEFVVLKDMIQAGSAESILSYILTQTTIVPIILFMLIITIGTMIASSIAQEKENKTLETILTVPVSRFTIVLAKMLAAVTLAIVFAFFFTLAMGSFMMPLSSPMAKISADMQQHLGQKISLGLDTGAKILLGLSIFLSIVNALAMATLSALFAQDVKDAQITIIPLTIMIVVPYLLAVMFDPSLMSLGLKIFAFLIPFSHTFFAFKFLILAQRLPVILGIIYLSLFAIALLIIATRIFSSELILTMKLRFGRISKS